MFSLTIAILLLPILEFTHTLSEMYVVVFLLPAKIINGFFVSHIYLTQDT